MRPTVGRRFRLKFSSPSVDVGLDARPDPAVYGMSVEQGLSTADILVLAIFGLWDFIENKRFFFFCHTVYEILFFRSLFVTWSNTKPAVLVHCLVLPFPFLPPHHYRRHIVVLPQAHCKALVDGLIGAVDDD